MNKPSRTELSAITRAIATRPANKLVRSKPSPMALEQRFMFDGAAVDAAAEVAKPAVDSLLNFVAADTALPAAVITARAEAEKLVTDFLAQPDAKEQLFAMFNGGQSAPTAEWQAAVDQLLAELQTGDDAVRVELRTSAELQGAKGAFSATGTTGQYTIYLNSDWLAGNPDAGIGAADSASVTSVLVEELGHYLDAKLNDGGDTAGDEGELFSRVVIDGANPLSVSFLSSQDDQTTLQIDGQSVQAELASFSFVGAYAMVYDLNNNGAVVGSTGETAAEKEQSTHNFNTTALGPASINDNSNSNLFSGNDVSAIGISIGGTTYYGWVSRPIKSGGVVKGFYFWTDAQFNNNGSEGANLAAAQADGNQDADGASDNKGFLLVVDQQWFIDQIAAKKTEVTLNNTTDGNVGTVFYSTVGSSSDRVDTALNNLIPPNAAPVAISDTIAISEQGTATIATGGNSDASTPVETFITTTSLTGVLANDNNGNVTLTSDTIKVTAAGTTTAGTAVAASTTSVNGTTVAGQYGSLVIGADGSYKSRTR